MTEKQTQLFSDVVKSTYLYPNSLALSELLDSDVIIHGVEFQKSGERETTYTQIGADEKNLKWYYTQSLVIREQCEQVKNALELGPVKATLLKRKNYYFFK